jgi:hypothetical protein
MLGSKTVPDDAFISVHPALGTSLLVSACLLVPLSSTHLVDSLDGIYPESRPAEPG